MAKTIWKFPLVLSNTQEIPMPSEARILTVQEQDGIPCIWAMVNPSNTLEIRIIEMFATGQSIREDMGVDRQYIGTVQLYNGQLVFHLFERIGV